ncbi:hypothetical protein GCM10011534_00490 [Pseudooceanicola nanhaiensis]|uniref:Uncharacterized protein n=1 Tax=Pseudooceanicola nanhaiensis TaxID=375761 RepID=A0A917W9C6_9RHOB|nr:hypothetical protein GCM10011534_00490 [Pseudooceanicola nanhaiensis]
MAFLGVLQEERDEARDVHGGGGAGVLGHRGVALEAFFVDFGETGTQGTLHLGSSTATKWLMPRMEGFAAPATA